MNKLITINETPEQAIKDLFASLLEAGKVSGIFSLRRAKENGSVDYALITDVAK